MIRGTPTATKGEASTPATSQTSNHVAVACGSPPPSRWSSPAVKVDEVREAQFRFLDAAMQMDDMQATGVDRSQ